MNYPDVVGVVDDRPDEIRLADAARTLHLRRQLMEAAEHGVALLTALGLPRLVTAEYERHEFVAIADALDVVIDHLDALDAPDEDREPYLSGDYNGRMDPEGEREGDEGPAEDDGISEPSLGAPERHSSPMLMFRGAPWTDRSANCRQTAWADAGRHDLEGCMPDDPHDGDNEDLEPDDDKEPVLGATEEIDQTGWAESGICDREFDATDCIDRHKPVAQWEASIARRGDMVALTRRAESLRCRQASHTKLAPTDPDTLIPIGPGMMWWGGPVARRRAVGPL